MSQFRSYHWWVTGSLFGVAAILYFSGFATGASAAVFFGFLIETVAWISFAAHPAKQPADLSSEDRSRG